MEIEFIKGGIDYLSSLPKKTLIKFYKKANHDYYNKGEPILSDFQYDILMDYIKEKYPKEIEIGSVITGRKKVPLPFFMGSMNKIKSDDKVINNWTLKYQGPYLISTKLDGISGLYDTLSNGERKLYTRGNGKEGQDISYLLPYLKIPDIQNIVVRGEFIIKKEYKIEKARNVVSGIISSKELHPKKLEMIDFIPYELISPEKTPGEQFKFLSEHFRSIVLYKEINEINSNILSSILLEWRNTYSYDIDGIIITDNHIYPRKNENPSHSFAFKMLLMDTMVETVVLDVLWNISKDGYIKPRVKLEPVMIDGVKIEYATGFNAKFITDHKIGLGAVVQIIRSGDVIPHILNVTEGSNEPKLPSFEYKWSKNCTDIIVKEKNESVHKEEILYFFRGMEIDGLGPKTVEKIYSSGIKTISGILKITPEKLKEIEGIQDKTAEKIYYGIKISLEKISLAKLLSLSNLFGRGFGEKKIELILENEKNWYKNPSIEKISNIKGMTSESARQFMENLPLIKKFLKEVDMEYKISDTTFHSLKKKGKILFSGFRSKELEEELEKRGYEIVNSLRKDLDYLIIPEKELKETVKVKKARELGVKILKKNILNILL